MGAVEFEESEDKIVEEINEIPATPDGTKSFAPHPRYSEGPKPQNNAFGMNMPLKDDEIIMSAKTTAGSEIDSKYLSKAQKEYLEKSTKKDMVTHNRNEDSLDIGDLITL